MAETTKTLAPPEPAPPTLAEQVAPSATTQTATPIKEQAPTQRASQQRSMMHRQGSQIRYFEELQRAAGNGAVSRMMTQRAGQPETQREATAIDRGMEQAPLTPKARAQAEETAVEQALAVARSDKPEFAQSVDVRPSSGIGESTQPSAETEAEAEIPPTQAAAPAAEISLEDTGEQAEVEEAIEDLEQTTEHIETEEGETGEEEARAVESEQQEEAVAPVVGEGGEGEIQATVDAAVVQLARPMAETAAISSQAVRFASRAEEKSTNPRVAQQATQKRIASEAVIADFVARNVHHAANLSAYGMTAVPRIMGAAVMAKASIDAVVAANVAAVAAQIAAAQGQVIAQAAAAKAIITAQSVLATMLIKAATIQAKADIEKAYADTKSALDTKETEQITAAGDLYTTWKPKYESTGTEIGNEALGIARQKANHWLSQRNGESTVLDGPIHDNRLEARADAAIKVAEEYKKGLQEAAKEQADKVTEGKPAVLDAVRQRAGEARTNLEAHRQSLIDALTNAETAASGQITGIATSLIAGVEAGQAASLASLATQQATQVARLFEYGNSQKTAIDEQAAQAVVALLAGTGEATTAYNEALHALITDALGSEAPDAAELAAILAQAQVQADMLAMNALLQLELGIQKSVEGINGGGVQSTEAVNQLGQSAVAQAASTSTEFTARTVSMVAQAIQGFAQLQEGHTKTVDETKTSATEGFEQAKTGLEETFTAISTNVKTSLSNGRTELKDALRREGLKDLEKTIQEQADKAADAVQPRWKKVVKALITIVVVIAVIALTIVTAGAGGVLGGILIGAALGGLAGATIQVGHNLVDGKEWSDGVGKAFVVGAIGGAFGGIGGALAKGVANVGLKFGLEVGVDVIGGIVGDLAVGNPITVEGVLLGAAIGAGVGGGLALGSALKGKIKIKPSIEVPSAGTRPRVEAPTPRTGAPEVAAPPTSRAAPSEVIPTPVPKAKPTAPEAPTASSRTQASEPVPSSKQKAHPDKPEVEDGIVARQKTVDGHEVKVTKDGDILKCTECKLIDAPSNAKARKELEDVKAIADPGAKARRAAEIDAEVSQKNAITEPEVKAKANTDADVKTRKATEADVEAKTKPEAESASKSPEKATTAVPDSVKTPPKPGEPGSPEHKAERWAEYQERTGGKGWDYDRWSKTYENNMQRARLSHQAADAYRERLGWGKREVTVDVDGTPRRLDIADVATRRGVEHKRGYVSQTEDVLSELARDAKLVKKGWQIEWVFEGTASKPLLEALDAAKIKYKFL